MHPELRYPEHIFTTYLALSSIILTPDNEHAFLFGIYGNMTTGDTQTIEFECGFSMLNDLLPLGDEQSEEAIEALAQCITAPTGDHQTIDLSEMGVHFYRHVFALQIIHELDEEDRPYLPKEPSYQLIGFTPIPSFFTEYWDEDIPTEKELMVPYFNKCMTLQYHLYLSFQKVMEENIALARTNLSDPLYFAMAKTQYELEVAKKKKDEDEQV